MIGRRRRMRTQSVEDKFAHEYYGAATDTKKNKKILRVIAPYIRIKRKVAHVEAKAEKPTKFSFYLQKKPAVLLHDLSSLISDSVDLHQLLHETSDVLKNITKASGVSLYRMNLASNEIYLSQTGDKRGRHNIKWKVEERSTVAAYVARKKEYVMVDDVIEDSRFPEGIGYEGNFTTRSVLAVPIITLDGDCFAVIELSRQYHEPCFTSSDLKIAIIATAWMGAAVHQNQQRLALKRQQELNDYLLDLTRCYFTESVVMEKMVKEVINFAKITMGAERGSFFIIDQDSDELVANLFDDDEQNTYMKPSKVRFGKERGIAGLVARTGETVNVKDAYNDKRFNKEIDQKTGFITRAILCMPVIGSNGILGVVQVVNKVNGGTFTSTDESLFKTFSMYCALALHYTRVNTHLTKTMLLNNLYSKLLRLQMMGCQHDYNNFLNEPFVNIPPDFEKFSWYVDFNSHTRMPQFCLHMLIELLGRSDIHQERSIKYILSARKLYRKNPYHNFEHAFNVAHCMYVILRKNREIFSTIEIKALIVAALCHDLDHVGLTNSFLQQTRHDLALLYESSTLEHHHIDVALIILNEYPIFRHMSEDDYKMFFEEVQAAILATDPSGIFYLRSEITKILDRKEFDIDIPLHRKLMKNLMMVTCDVSGQCKPYLIANRIIDNVYRELYHQGDLEKQLGLCPLSQMDRTKQLAMAEDQVQYLTVIVIPCVDLMRRVLPNTEGLYSGAVVLVEQWKEVISVRGKKCWKQGESIAKKYTDFKPWQY